MSKKLNLRDRVVDGELDLSLSDLQEVPVREIVPIKKATSLDLSNNRLTNIGKNFALLTQLVRLDLSKNQIKKLPDNFGDLVLLKHLDLYSNQLAHLPLSFGQLKNLKWLDLKSNPLVPALAEVAGPCQDNQQCQLCARKVVKVIGDAKQRVDEERRKVELLEKEKEMAEKAAAKKEQQKNKKATKNEKKKAQENGVKGEQHTQTNTGNQKKKDKSNKGGARTQAKKSSRSVVRSLLKLLFVLLLTSSTVLGFLYLVDIDKYIQVRQGAGRLLNATVELLPAEVVNQGKVAAEYVRPTVELIQTKTRTALNETSTFLNTDPRVKLYWANLKDVSAATCDKLVELLRTVYKQAPVYYHDLKDKWFK